MTAAPQDLSFGRLPDMREVRVLTVGTPPGPVLDVLTRGAAVNRLEVACGDGVRRNVALGHATLDEALRADDFLGSTIGRYANRIADGRFSLGGRTIVVGANDRGHALHGGPDGFDRRLWDVQEHTGTTLTLSLTSPSGDQGFPGTLEASVTYEVGPDGVDVTLEAATDETTVVNLTSHAYFNLDGSGTVEDHLLEVAAARYTPVDATGIPLGEHAPVEGTPFDFRRPTRLGAALGAEHPQLTAADGIDHNFVVDGVGPRFCAALESPRTRTRLELHADQPGLQVFTHNSFGDPGPPPAGHPPRAGVALEPQLFPDSPNRPAWPSATLEPGERYRSRLQWRFLSTSPTT